MGEQKRYMLEERCLFLLAHEKEQAIDEYYRQVGGGWLFLWRNVKNDRFSLHISEKFSIFARNFACRAQISIV